jgi:hypothetical protein
MIENITKFLSGKKVNFVYGILGIAFMLVVANIFAQPIATIASSDEISNMKIYFAEAVSIDDVLREANSQGLQVVALQDSFDVEGIRFTDFYFLRSQKMNARKVLKGYRNARVGFLRDVADNMKDIKTQNKNNKTVKLANTTFDLIQKSKTTKIVNKGVEAAIIRGRLQDAQAIKEKLGISRIEVSQSNQKQDLAENSQAVTLQSSDPNTWAPKQGYSYVFPSSVQGERYTTQYMWWNDVSGFDAISTYEHDFFLNNYDGQTYLDSGQDLWGFPNVTYAASNLPRPYLDTRFSDPEGEKAYTIGSSEASSIQANTSYWYYNYIRTLEGNADTDTGKLQAQLGYRSPSWCYENTWCSYSIAIENLISAWNISVPGSQYWVR